jgi:iron(III) transport system ATP-binding protein
MIAGLLEPHGGEILFDGKAVTRVPPWQRNIGMVFQNYALWPHMTVFENVAFGLVERRAPRGEVGDRVEEALRLVGLEGLGRRLPSQLSGGQQQRVALARAIVVQPALLLLDEPLSNLDARLRVQMRNELVKLQRQLGITTIYVTHDQEEALMLSTRIAVMHRGHLVQLGTPEQVYERPADAFVADFLGGANFLAGTVRSVFEDGIVVALENGPLVKAAAARNPGVRAGERVTVCLRPEILELAEAGAGTGPDPGAALQASGGAGGTQASREGGGPQAAGAGGLQAPGAGAGTVNVLEGTLRLRNYLGWVMTCEVELAGGTPVRVQTTNPRAFLRFTEGGPVAIRFLPEDVLLLRESA